MVWEESNTNRPRPQSIIESLWSLLHSRKAPVLHHFVAPEQSVFSEPADRQSDQWWDGDGRKFWRKKKNEGAQSSFPAARGSTLTTIPSRTPSHGNLEAREGSRLFFENSRSPLQNSEEIKTLFQKLFCKNFKFGFQMIQNQISRAAAALRAC